MKKLSTLILLCFAMTITILLGCNSSDKSCQETICTTIFVTVTVSIVDQNQDPIVLDSYEVINLENNAPITLSLTGSELDSFIQNGQYPIMDDLSIQENQQLNLQFRGTLNGQEVVNENYTVAKDCCHVSLVSGNLEIIL